MKKFIAPDNGFIRITAIGDTIFKNMTAEIKIIIDQTNGKKVYCDMPLRINDSIQAEDLLGNTKEFEVIKFQKFPQIS